MLAALAAAAIYCGLQTRLDPIASSGPQERRFLGPVSFNLPAEFQAVSGRLRLLCLGPPGLTRVFETPHPPYGQSAYAQPAGLPLLSQTDLSPAFGRPARLILSDSGPAEVLADMLLDFGLGTVRLSRPLSRGRLEEEIAAFEAEAKIFSENYAWGHTGPSGGLHSLYGRLKTGLACRRARGAVKFAAAGAATLEVILTGPGDPAPGPVRLQDGRRVRSGPRRLDGRPGRELVTLRRDPRTGRAGFWAVWRPAAGPAEADSAETGSCALILSAETASAETDSAGRALGYWDELLASFTFRPSDPAGAGTATGSEPW
ncbi:MAG: hypothetical protein LBV21_03855 [Candidatus Adiutrix sp.]|jgi:hypothetical protein|nr:hypothetical protein [Candidatus Adiutrix sp.]